MKHHISYFIPLLLSCVALVGCTSEIERSKVSIENVSSSQAESATSYSGTDIPAAMPNDPTEEATEAVRTGFFSTVQDVGIYEVDGQEQTYAFLYDDEIFYAVYSPDNWKIIDSYKITNTRDIELICQALIEVYPIHGSDMVSYRTAKDMAREWQQHNLAYKLLPDDSPWKQSVKDVDIDPADQGKSYYEFYKERFGSAEPSQTTNRHDHSG